MCREHADCHHGPQATDEQVVPAGVGPQDRASDTRILPVRSVLRQRSGRPGVRNRRPWSNRALVRQHHKGEQQGAHGEVRHAPHPPVHHRASPRRWTWNRSSRPTAQLGTRRRTVDRALATSRSGKGQISPQPSACHREGSEGGAKCDPHRGLRYQDALGAHQPAVDRAWRSTLVLWPLAAHDLGPLADVRPAKGMTDRRADPRATSQTARWPLDLPSITGARRPVRGLRPTIPQRCPTRHVRAPC